MRLCVFASLGEPCAKRHMNMKRSQASQNRWGPVTINKKPCSEKQGLISSLLSDFKAF
jgi:hypothetical protein